MQKILSIVWFKIYPPYFGGQKGIASFNKYLSEHFEIDCICSKDNERTVDAGCNIIPVLPTGKTQFFNPLVWRRIKHYFNKKSYRFILLEFPYYGLLGSWLRSKDTFLIIHMHNIEAERFKNLGKPGWYLLRVYEKWCLRQCDLILFKTEEDRQFSINHFGLKAEKCYVLPYGVEKSSIFNKEVSRKYLQEKYNIKPEEKILLFAGTLDYLPNAKAVEAIYNDIAPRLDQEGIQYRILICGRNKFSSFAYLRNLEHPHVLQTGFVEDIALYFAGADVFINPVQEVHGIQTKLFDALNFNLNVVSFTKATESLPTYIHTKLFVTDNNNFGQFVQNVIAALVVTADTPEAFYHDYSWKGIVDKFARHLKYTFTPANNT